MATATAANDPVTQPEVRGVVAYVQVSDCAAAIDLYKRVFAAEELGRTLAEGKIMHAHLRINGGDLFLCDPVMPGRADEVPMGYVLHVQVDDAAAWFTRAARELDVTMPLEVMFWGDKYGQLQDRFGVRWSIGGPAT